VPATTYDNDQALMIAFQSGSETAFTQLYRRFHRPLYFYAQRFVGAEDAADILADTFVGLWEQRSNFSAVAAAQQWLFVTVRNRAVSILRRQIKGQEAAGALLHQLETSEENDLYLEELTIELMRHLHTEIDKLPPRQREVFLLSFRDGLKPAQIAEQLGLSVKTVKNQKLSAMRVLQAALGPRAALLSLLVLLHEELQASLPVCTP
jgi:RNA polymerase sigma-70 factor (family 1)